MSKQHPVVAVTGSSGAGTTTVKRAFEHIFLREGINAAVVEGDSFHRYERAEMKIKMAEEHLSHFGPEANRFDKLEELFRTYGETGTGEKRYYLRLFDSISGDPTSLLSYNLHDLTTGEVVAGGICPAYTDGPTQRIEFWQLG